ncbi:hypothetical protein QBC47DRAFT_118296 [Echria macrotheca]|uniref:Cyanovirin-N domain-containing protein n=1 Tax=Echria macrotheca TaxID=438768 RepID=A0AAJ0F1Y8_9PEZI|nr:hypothetical protein QBC47DRAFT_118296 [Echria macrotheca]
MAFTANLSLLVAAFLAAVAPVLSSPTVNEVDNRISVRSTADLGLPDPQPGKINCGIYNTADRPNAIQINFDLAENVNTCTTPPKTCRRHACWNTSGVFICNDSDLNVTLECGTVARFAGIIIDDCCRGKGAGLSGQVFSDQGWNAVVSYANCNHDRDADRPGMGPADNPWGPNGSCW